MPRRSRGGRCGSTILIGVQKHILFAPVLTPQRLWNMSIRRCLDAIRMKRSDTAEFELSRLSDHLGRVPRDDPQLDNMQSLLVTLEQKVSPEGRP